MNTLHTACVSIGRTAKELKTGAGLDKFAEPVDSTAKHAYNQQATHTNRIIGVRQ